MNTVTKAIIPVAGWGTRMLPITKSIEKCMLPVGTRPVIDYVVRDCVDAGISDIYFVVGEQSTQIQSYYRSNIQLNDYLRSKGKEDKLELVAPLSGVSIHFITQPSSGKYGTAVPVGLAAPYIQTNESVLVLMGDDFIYNPNSTNQIKRLIDEASDDGAAMFGVAIPQNEVSRYGVLALDGAGNYQSIVEKPSVEDAPSNLINVSKYLLPKVVIDASAKVAPNPERNEYELTDVVNEFVRGGAKLAVVQPKGEYLDCGTPEGWLHANNIVAGLS